MLTDSISLDHGATGPCLGSWGQLPDVVSAAVGNLVRSVMDLILRQRGHGRQQCT